MTKIYGDWVRDFDIDGFRHRHRQARQPGVLAAVGQGIDAYAADRPARDFFMFGEVYSADPAVTSTYVRQGGLPATLDFPFQEAARATPPQGGAAEGLADVYAKDDLYTDAGHQRLRAGHLPRQPRHGPDRLLPRRPAATTADASSRRDRLANELMFLSRGQPVVYYGDEQGFTGAGGDKDARQDMFASQDGRLPRRRPDRHRPHPRERPVRHQPTRSTGPSPRSAGCARRNPALRDGVQVPGTRPTAPGVFAFSRIDRGQQHRVRGRASTTRPPRRPSPCDTWSAGTAFTGIYGGTGRRRPPAPTGSSTVTVPAAVGRRVQGRPGRSPQAAAPAGVTLTAPAAGAGRPPGPSVTADGDRRPAGHGHRSPPRSASGKWTAARLRTTTRRTGSTTT